MRFLGLLKKTLIENFRDWKILILILTFAPFFVLLMHLYFGEGTKVYRIAVVNFDQGVVYDTHARFNAGENLISELKKLLSPKGKPFLQVKKENSLDIALRKLADKSIDMVVEFPSNLSRVLQDYKLGRQPPQAIIRTHGDSADINYIMAALWSDVIAFQYAKAVTGWKGPLELQVNSIGNSKSLNGFDLYVPALLALSLMMLMFTAAASLIKEKDKDTIIRLRISNMTTFEWISAVSCIQMLIGLVSLGLAFLTALSLGYQTSGSLPAMMVVGVLSSLAMMAISVVVAAVLRTVFDLMTIGCFPFFILMFFSGGMFPLPTLTLFKLGDRSIDLNGILPTTHAIAALNKILNYGATLGEVLFEIAAIILLTILFFGVGIWMFTRRHMRA